MKNLFIAAIAILSLQACSSDEKIEPQNNAVLFEINFFPVDHSIFDIEYSYGVNKLEATTHTGKSNAGINVYLKKGDEIHIKLTKAQSAMKVQIAPQGQAFVYYDLTLNETLIVKY